MNILVLTPDGVGSTILQRLLTMLLYLEGQKVRNTHELTNGLEIRDGIAIKNFKLAYTQNLQEIIKILQSSSNETMLVSRLAKYHIDQRNDSLHDRNKFYEFLNKFYNKKIMCVRDNVFEYALSWSIRQRSGVLNVYDQADRQKVNEISEVDENFFLKKCQEYVDYEKWVENFFPDVNVLSYESMLRDADAVLENITEYKNIFYNNFQISLSDIIKAEYNFLKNKNKSLDLEQARGLAKYKLKSIEMLKNKIIIDIPQKNTTLTDKKRQIKNFDRCLDKFYEFARNHNRIDQSKATYDFWNKKHIC